MSMLLDTTPEIPTIVWPEKSGEYTYSILTNKDYEGKYFLRFGTDPLDYVGTLIAFYEKERLDRIKMHYKFGGRVHIDLEQKKTIIGCSTGWFGKGKKYQLLEDILKESGFSYEISFHHPLLSIISEFFDSGFGVNL